MVTVIRALTNLESLKMLGGRKCSTLSHLSALPQLTSLTYCLHPLGDESLSSLCTLRRSFLFCCRETAPRETAPSLYAGTFDVAAFGCTAVCGGSSDAVPALAGNLRVLRLSSVTDNAPALRPHPTDSDQEDAIRDIGSALSRLETLKIHSNSLSARAFWTLPFHTSLQKLVLTE